MGKNRFFSAFETSGNIAFNALDPLANRSVAACCSNVAYAREQSCRNFLDKPNLELGLLCLLFYTD